MSTMLLVVAINFNFILMLMSRIGQDWRGTALMKKSHSELENLKSPNNLPQLKLAKVGSGGLPSENVFKETFFQK